MHYCFFTTGSWQGNASLVRLREFGREMIVRGVRVSYLVDDVPYNHTKLDLHPDANVAFVPEPKQFSQFKTRRAILGQLAPDFVHVLNPSVKAFLTLRSTNYNVVGDWDEWPARRPLPPARKLVEMFLDRWQRRRAVTLVVASRYLQHQFQHRFGLTCAYIPYATYLQSHPDGETPFDEPTAVYMGNLFPAYDHDLIFNAARILQTRGESPRIAILGGGPDLEKWRQFVRDHKLDNVRVAGFVSGEELWRHLRHAHVLLFPIRENLLNRCRCPSKTFAYAQAKRPVITNHVGEIPAVLEAKATYVNATSQGFADAISQTMKQSAAPDVDYAIERHRWGSRTEDLLAALPKLPTRDTNSATQRVSSANGADRA